ncbi:hypothetical protein H8356DRAFT_1405744 [Neocallimastix lanati (nom. inval.)]|nr:hypothetical protein H8356DRAFT_1405744 [Neocallimastix sp. JGI-2020a]
MFKEKQYKKILDNLCLFANKLKHLSSHTLPFNKVFQYWRSDMYIITENFTSTTSPSASLRLGMYNLTYRVTLKFSRIYLHGHMKSFKNKKIGWNLSNMLDCETASETCWSSLCFNTFRIPTTWSGHFGRGSQYKTNAIWMKTVHEIKQIASKLKKYDEHLIFECMNEQRKVGSSVE